MTSTLKDHLARGGLINAPGVFELISALVADRMGFPALYVTGYGTVASHLGLPDAGIATYTDMLGRIATICARTSTPVIADADTGYGGLLNVHHTVQGYEAAGVAAIQIEDQEFPKKCGHTPHRRVIPAEDMARKIEVAVAARKGDMLIIARTDARTGLGLDEALRRAKLYGEAGADILFVESPETEAEMARIGAELDLPLMVNMAQGGRTPALPAARLAELGYAIAIHPTVGFLAMGAALEGAYDDLRQNGQATGRVPMYPFAEFNALVGFPEVHAFEERFSEIGT